MNENKYCYQTAQIILQIKMAAKKGVWLSSVYKLNNGETIGIKAFGKWVQIIEYKGIKSDIAEQKTWKAFEELFIKEMNKILSIN